MSGAQHANESGEGKARRLGAFKWRPERGVEGALSIGAPITGRIHCPPRAEVDGAIVALTKTDNGGPSPGSSGRFGGKGHFRAKASLCEAVIRPVEDDKRGMGETAIGDDTTFAYRTHFQRVQSRTVLFSGTPTGQCWIRLRRRTHGAAVRFGVAARHRGPQRSFRAGRVGRGRGYRKLYRALVNEKPKKLRRKVVIRENAHFFLAYTNTWRNINNYAFLNIYKCEQSMC